MYSRWTLPTLARLVALFFVLAALVGCSSEPTLVLTSWDLDTESVHGVHLTLPAHLDRELGAKRAAFTLRTRVAIPDALRGKALTLAVPMLQGPCVLLANGRRMAPLDVGTTTGYRGARHPRWAIPEEISASPSVDLELALEHTWTQTAWLDTPPRLSATPEGDRAYRAISGVTDYCAAGCIAALSVAVFMYLLMYLMDRKRVEYAWWVVEAASGIPYPAFVLGLTPPILGPYDATFMSFGLCLSIWGGVRFTHLQFGLPRPHAAWTLAPITCAAASLFFGGPFWSTRVVTPITVVAVLTNIGYQLYQTATRWRGTERRIQALVLFLGWGAVGVIGLPDFVAWLGMGEVAGGARTASIGVALIAILQSVVLSSEHVASLRDADRLNAELASRVDALQAKNREVEVLNSELRRQIGARSEQLAYALTRLSVTNDEPQRELGVGEMVDDRYKVIATTGRGGMGTVYQVERVSDGRRLALKLLSNAGVTDMARFAREAQIVARLDHPNIVSIVDVDVAVSGFLYIVMEYVEGRSLDDHKARYGDPGWAIPVLRQIAEGLAAIHRHGVVHRDLKPANVLVSPAVDGSTPLVKIADFGISRLGALDGESIPVPPYSVQPPLSGSTEVPTFTESLPKTARLKAPPPPHSGVELHHTRPPSSSGSWGGPSNSRPPSSGSSSQHNLTETGVLMGTPRYMAPELVGEAKLARPPSDLFSFGVIAYELLTQSVPFREPAAVLRMNNEQIPPPAPLVVRGAQLDPELAMLIEQCLAEEPGGRPTAARITEALAKASARVA